MEKEGASTDNSRMSMRRRHRESGQAAVETAIVMPLFLFILLGLIQLGLLHQSRLLTKYAAYKAVRAGSINRADAKIMRQAAVAVMLPLLSQSSPAFSGDARHQPQYMVYNVSTAGKYKQAFNEVVSSRSIEAFGKPMLTVTICTPLSSGGGVGKDFDDHRTNPSDWKSFDNTKLAVQVTSYMPLYIPFANAFIWWAARGENGTGREMTMKTLRMKTGTKGRDGAERKSVNKAYTLLELEDLAKQGTYIMPVRASYAMRMHSNFKDALPANNECHISWEKKK